MRKLIYLLMALLSLSALVMAENATSYADARALSAKTGKPILLDFMTEW